ncbi:hypothetical protein [Aurantiacibacter zhengii]|uniref:hypothetical protein n=1 Tax=Aurantiacibacter zhengii TaxID=2307003 RepID=UPI0011C21EC3|nr:hypothetical protein [Aurantiacibacter zhengii]
MGEPSAALLSRLLGFFSQHDLGAPEMTVTRRGGDMIVQLESADLGAQLAPVVSAKMGSLVGVRHVDLTFTEIAADHAPNLALQPVPAHRPSQRMPGSRHKRSSD